MYGKLSLKLRNLNEHLVCVLCGGYFVDATTIIECLHSFCRSCIVRYMTTNKCCPKCELPAHKTRPLLNIRSDKTLQDIVFKLVPELHENETSRRKEFYLESGLPCDDIPESPQKEQKSEEKNDQRISLSLECDKREVSLEENTEWIKQEAFLPKKYLRASESANIGVINKLIRLKLQQEDCEVISFCRGEVIPEFYTLMDVTNVFSWKSDRPLSLTYMSFVNKTSESISKSFDDLKETTMKTTNSSRDEVFSYPQKENDFTRVSDSSKPKTPETKMAVVPELWKPKTPSIEQTRDSKFFNSNASSKFTSPKSPTLGSVPASKPQASAQNGKKYILPKPPALTSIAPSSKPHNSAQNGKNLAFYSVLNVPLHEAVKDIKYKPDLNQSKKQIHGDTSDLATGPRTNSQVVNNGGGFAQTSHQSSQNMPTVHERIKSINSIANRLQMKQQMQSRQSSVDSSKVLNSPSNTPALIGVNPAGTFQPIRPGPRPYPYHGLTNDEAHSLALERAREKMMSGKPPSAYRPMHPGYNIPNPSSPAKNEAKNFIQLERGNFVVGPQGTLHQQHRTPQAKPRQPRQQRILPNKIVRNSDEDIQMLNAKRQLAALRQQQKFLNNLAAAVASKTGTSFSSGESFQGVVSSTSSSKFTPKLSSYRHIVPRSSIGGNFVPKDLIRPPISSRFPNPVHVSNLHGAAFKQNGSSPRPPRIPHPIGYPALNARREGNIDIYQNTIEKARACVREMNLKQKLSPALSQARSSAAPYRLPQKILPKFQQERPRYMAPPNRYQPPMNVVSKHLNVNSSNANPGFRSPNPYPAMGSPRTPMNPPGSYNPDIGNFAANKQRAAPLSSQLPPTAAPVQDQPLCLVVRK